MAWFCFCSVKCECVIENLLFLSIGNQMYIPWLTEKDSIIVAHFILFLRSWLIFSACGEQEHNYYITFYNDPKLINIKPTYFAGHFSFMSLYTSLLCFLFQVLISRWNTLMLVAKSWSLPSGIQVTPKCVHANGHLSIYCAKSMVLIHRYRSLSIQMCIWLSTCVFILDKLCQALFCKSLLV